MAGVRKGPIRRIRTVLNGDQAVYSTELELLHTPSLQRLYGLHQLGLTDRVFIDASHSRLHHVVGVMEQASRLMRAIAENLARQGSRRFVLGQDPDDDKSVTLTALPSSPPELPGLSGLDLSKLVRGDECKARLIGLLHDLTHAPFGHTLEDEIELVDSKHDEPKRQAAAFYRLVLELVWCWARDCGLLSDPNSRTALSNESAQMLLGDEDVRYSIDLLRRFADALPMANPPEDDRFVAGAAKLCSTILSDTSLARPLVIGRGPSLDDLKGLIADLRFAMRALLYLELLHRHEPKLKHVPDRDGEYPVEKLLSGVLQQACDDKYQVQAAFVPAQHAYLLDVIGNTICADLLDYARRDSFFANLKLDYDGDRIVENMTLVAYEDNERQWALEGPDPFAGTVLRTGMGMFSHKLRMDVPGALLHLLHVRFYVYQRALFHPTKCVAGAMLGCALQLLGFEESNFPDHLAYVGDETFLDQIRGGARLAKSLLQTVEAPSTAASLPTQLNGDKSSTNGQAAVTSTPLDSDKITALAAGLRFADSVGTECVAASILRARVRLASVPTTGQADGKQKKRPAWLPAETDRASVVSSIRDLDAALVLLDRLASRRYFRPVFRLLPNVGLPRASLSHKTVAEPFLKPGIRWFAERTIEREAGLPLGTVVIHCPVAKGPAKIAAILMVWTDVDGEEIAKPLKEIGDLDAALFGQIQAAIEALENMYASMWRLVVSVEPAAYAIAVAESARSHKADAGQKADLFSTSPPTIEGVIGDVLGRVMRKRRRRGRDVAGSLPNDWTMREELITADGGREEPKEHEPSERVGRLTDEFLEHLKERTGIDVKLKIRSRMNRAAARPPGARGVDGETLDIVEEIAEAFRKSKPRKT